MMFRLLLFSSLLNLVHGACPSPLTLYRDGQCRGKEGNFGMGVDESITQAITNCRNIHAFPVSIHNDEQQNYWKSKKSSYNFVIGLTCNTNSKQWNWADGTMLDFKPPAGKYDAELDQDCITGISWFLDNTGSWIHNPAWTQFTDVYCILQLKQPTASTDCGSFDDDSDDSVCYEIAKTAENWKDAQTICHSFGAEVASVHSLQENSYIRRLAAANGALNGVLLGATISGKGSDFGWIDGTEWDYSNFYPSFPIEGLGECLTMDTVGAAGQWMNTDCATKVPVVCARPLHDTPERDGCCAGPWNEGQIIYSPGFPNDASVPCDYFLTVPTGKKVKLEILVLEANTCCDYVVLTDGYVAGPIIANLTGEISGKYYYTSQSNIMRVSWLPNGGVNVRGLMMSFWAN